MYRNELEPLLLELSKIPAPSGIEDKRVEFISEWLKNNDITFLVDSAKNIIVPFGKKENLTVYLAHTDLVFPDTDTLPLKEDNKNYYCPGIGDNTVHVAQLMVLAKELYKTNFDKNILIVFNSCEEGLGNLKGIKQIMKDYEGKISKVISFDGQYNRIINKCVGSERYHIAIKTEGGHSFNAFGNSNAIEKMSRLICELYNIEVPEKENTKTTYNVGQIIGGTSVNTIAQSAKILYEFRSDDEECLGIMRNKFEEIINSQKEKGIDISLEIIGIRPCAKGVDSDIIKNLCDKVNKIIFNKIGENCVIESGSTDSNIPMSIGIPSITVGGYLGGGAHTREEWLEKASLIPGYEIVKETVYQLS